MSIGNQIGTGKESDVFIGTKEDGAAVAVKFHRLGRTSFRSIKRNRDYHKGRTHASWLYLSRLAALKEFAYMKVLFENGFPVPTPIDVNRHVVVMEHLAGYTTLVHINELKHPGKLYNTLMNLLVSLAECGLIHGDFNEFNLMIDGDENVVMIDFPQMVSIDHENADYYFDRDVQGVRTFFRKRFGFHGAQYPVLDKDIARKHHLDVQIQASGFSKQDDEDFKALIEAQSSFLNDNPDASSDEEDNEDESDSNDDDLALDSDDERKGLSSTFQKINMGDYSSSEDSDDDDDHLPSSTAQNYSSLDSKQNQNRKTQNEDDAEEEEEEEEDDAPPEETRKERKERLQRKAAEKAAKKASATSSASTSNVVEAKDEEEPIVPEPGEEGLDEDTIRRNRIIRDRVKSQLERRRIRDRQNAKNAFKLQAKRNLAQQTRGWSEEV